MPSPSRSERGEFDTLASLIDNLKDVARLQQLVETLATNQRDLTESLAEHRELYAERWAALTNLAHRLDVLEKAGSDLQNKIERRAGEVLDDFMRSASRLLDRVTKIEQDLANNGQINNKLHNDFAQSVADFQKKIDDLHKRITDKPGIDTTAPVVVPGVTNFRYGKVNVTASNYLVVILLISITIWSLSPVGQHFLHKYLPTDSATKTESSKPDTGLKIDTKGKDPAHDNAKRPYGPERPEPKT